MSRGLIIDLGRAAGEGWNRRLPARYDYSPTDGPAGFRARAREAMHEGCSVLDIGAGAMPTIKVSDRPPGCTYVGLDVSHAELLRAPSASYDEIVVADATEPISELEGRFDLVVSWFALEHLRPLRGAVHNLRSYLRPGGRFVAYCSGRFAISSLLNQALPQPISSHLLRRLNGRSEDSIHPAHYDRCTYTALKALFTDGWERSEIVPCYTGGKYFRFSRPLHAIYLCYEESIYRADKRNLAPYFLVDATAGQAGLARCHAP